MVDHRHIYNHVEALQLKIVVLCTLFALINCKTCTMAGTPYLVSYDDAGWGNVLAGDMKIVMPENSITKLSSENMYGRSNLFCSSTLSGLFSDFHKSEANVSRFGGSISLVLFLVCSFIFLQVLSFISQRFQFRGRKSFILSNVKHESFSFIHCCRKYGSRVLSINMNGRSIDEGAPFAPSKLGKIRSSASPESPSLAETGNLTVKTGKDKGRRRKKKRSSCTGRTEQFEASSSHSSNSTPSSPSSPISSNQSHESSPDVNRHFNGLNLSDSNASMKYISTGLPFPTKVQLPTSEETVRKSVLLQSTSNLAWPLATGVSSPTIAPYARAPGSKLYGNEVNSGGKKSNNVDKFEYDIWGDHLGLRFFIDLSKDVSVKSFVDEASDFDSFFARGPQSLLTISQAKLVSFNQYG